MKHASQSQFGRPASAVPVSGDGPDKWALLTLLTEAAEDFGLNHRTLGVLRALLSFVPARTLPSGPAAVVFASNRALSERLNGMPDSTLRRHLAQLVARGIVSRQASPNNKRYARQVGRQIALAFGFDLTPLAQLSAELEQRAAAARARRECLDLLRTRVLMLRARVIAAMPEDTSDTLMDEAARLLRRKPDAAALEEMAEALSQRLAPCPAPDSDAEKMSASDIQNERHIQKADESILIKNAPQNSDTGTDRQEPVQCAEKDQISLAQVTATCRAFQDYFPEPVGDWHQLCTIASRLGAMMGIDPFVIHHANRVMGAQRAATVLLCMLERLAHIRTPGAYLRQLIKAAETGSLHIGRMLRRVETGKLSADNSNSPLI